MTDRRSGKQVSRQFDHEILLLQGGRAMIAGSPPQRRVERLRTFWERLSGYAPMSYPAWMDPVRSGLDLRSAGTVMAFGSPGFFVRRVPPALFVAWLVHAVTARPTKNLPKRTP
jgi:hypothetical protein